MKDYYAKDGNQLFSITLEEWTGNVHKRICVTHPFFLCFFLGSQANLFMILQPYLSCPVSDYLQRPSQILGKHFLLPAKSRFSFPLNIQLEIVYLHKVFFR